jgi:hypothetical protein
MVVFDGGIRAMVVFDGGIRALVVFDGGICAMAVFAQRQYSRNGGIRTIVVFALKFNGSSRSTGVVAQRE